MAATMMMPTVCLTVLSMFFIKIIKREAHKHKHIDVHWKYVENCDALHKIRNGHREHQPALNGMQRGFLEILAAMFLKELPIEHEEYSEIAHEAKDAGLRKIIEEYAV